MRQRVQAICSLIIVQKTAAVAPATAPVFRRFWWLPFPGPVELNGRTTASRVISHKLHVGIVLQVGIRMELAGDQVVQFLGIRCMRERKAREHSVSHFR